VLCFVIVDYHAPFSVAVF